MLGLFQRLRETPRDTNGQPLNRAFRSEAIIDRQIDELIGLCKGVLADGNVDANEAHFLLNWLETNQAAASKWPANVLYPRIAAALLDGVLGDDEERELLSLLRQTVGGNAPANGEASASTELPLTHPAPSIAFDAREFCFTGKFYSGSRQWCERQVLERGGSIGGITKRLNYLVIGEIGSRDWIHSTHGRKIEKAVAYNCQNCSIAIVAERHWHGCLNPASTL